MNVGITAYQTVAYIEMGMFIIIGVLALAGAVVAATTREDAFTAGDRKPKLMWVGMLVASAVVLIVASHVPILPWVAAVITGIFWCDVNPQLRALIRGDFNY